MAATKPTSSRAAAPTSPTEREAPPYEYRNERFLRTQRSLVSNFNSKSRQRIDSSTDGPERAPPLGTYDVPPPKWVKEPVYRETSAFASRVPRLASLEKPTRRPLDDFAFLSTSPAAAALGGAPDAAAAEIPPLEKLQRRLSDPTRYMNVEALLASVDSGAIRPLRGSWLVKHAFQSRNAETDWRNHGTTLGNRQQLERAFRDGSPFFPADLLRKYASNLGRDAGVLFVAFSSASLDEEHSKPDDDGHHADPQGLNLRILAEAARLYLKPPDGTTHFSPLSEAFYEHKVGASADFALFWEWPCVYQPPCTPPKEELREASKGAIPCWFGSSETTVWLQPSPPLKAPWEAAFTGTSYDLFAWRVLEAGISAVLTPLNRRLDLSPLTALVPAPTLPGGDDEDDEEAAAARRFVSPIAYGVRSRFAFASSRLDTLCSAPRPAPFSPHDMKRRMDTRICSPQLDKELLAAEYSAFFQAVVDLAPSLSFGGAGLAGAEDGARLGFLLSRCNALTSLDLSNNPGLDDSAGLALATALDTGLANIKTIDFAKNTGVQGEGARRLAESAFHASGEAGKRPLHTFSRVPLKALRNGRLLELDLKHSGLAATEGYLIAKLIAASETLQSVDLHGNELLRGDCAAAIADAVVGSTTLQLFATLPVAVLRADSLVKKLDLSHNPGSFVSRLGLVGDVDLKKGLRWHGLLISMLGNKELRSTFPPKLGLVEALVVARFIKASSILERVDLSANELEDDAAKALGEALVAGAQPLRFLDVSLNRLSMQAKRALVALVRQRNHARMAAQRPDDDAGQPRAERQAMVNGLICEA